MLIRQVVKNQPGRISLVDEKLMDWTLEQERF